MRPTATLQSTLLGFARAGLAHCVETYGHDAVMNIDVGKLDQSNPGLCMRAQASGMSYFQSLERHPLTEREEVELGFVGSFHAPSYPDGDVHTDELTHFARETVAMYQIGKNLRKRAA